MYTDRISIKIDRPRKHVFQIAETYPRLVSFYKSGEILYQDDKCIKVRVTSNIFGIPTSWEGKGEKKKYESIEYIQTRGLFKGLVAAWHFKDADESTVVSIRVSFAL